MIHSPPDAFPVDHKGTIPEAGLPSPVNSIQERNQTSRFRRALTGVLVVLGILFVAHRCERHFSMGLENSPPLETTVDDQVAGAEKLEAASKVLQEGAHLDVDASTCRQPIWFPRTFVQPTDETCLDKWVVDTHMPSPFATPSGDRRFRATSLFTLRQDVHTYIIDTDIVYQLPSVHLHVVPARGEYTTVNIDVFYDEPAALDVFYPCTYRADETEELLSQQWWAAIDLNGTKTTKPVEYDPDNLQKSDVLRLQRRAAIQDESVPAVPENVWFNITLAISSSNRAYSLRSDQFDIDLHAGLALDEVRLGVGRIFAHEGFTVRELSIHSHTAVARGGVFGHFTTSGNVSIVAMGAPVDVHVETMHSLLYQAQTVTLHTYAAPLKATLLLMDSSRQNTFKVIATAREGSLDLTLRNGSTYGSVSIDAEAVNAPARLKLDTAFEGTFVAKTVDSDESEGATAAYHGEPCPGNTRVFRAPFQTRHIHVGAVGRETSSASSFAEVRSIQGSAYINLE